MGTFPRSQQQVGASNLTQSTRFVRQGEISTLPSADALNGFFRSVDGAVKSIDDAKQTVLKRDGESEAVERFAEFQLQELTRFNEAKAASQNSPQDFSKRFLEESRKNFDEFTKGNENQYFQKIMEGRYSGLTNSLIYGATSFEAKQKIDNRKKAYASAVGSYTSTVYNQPEKLRSVISQMKGDKGAAAASAAFGSELEAVATKAGKRVAKSAVMGMVEKNPARVREFIEEHGLQDVLGGKEIKKIMEVAKTNFEQIPKIEQAKKQMNLVNSKQGVMENYINGTLTLGAIEGMDDLDEDEKDIARTLAVGGKNASDKNPEILADLMFRKKELLERDGLTIGNGLNDLVKYQNDVYSAIGGDINNSEAKMLLKGTVDGINAALQSDTENFGARGGSKAVVFGKPLFGRRKLEPEEKAIMAIQAFAKDKPPVDQRKILRGVSKRIEQSDFSGFDDDDDVDDNGKTMKDRQVDAIINSEIKKSVKGLEGKSGTPNRVIGQDGTDSVITNDAATTKADVSIVPDAPAKKFATMKEAEAAEAEGFRGVALINGQLYNIVD